MTGKSPLLFGLYNRVQVAAKFRFIDDKYEKGEIDYDYTQTSVSPISINFADRIYQHTGVIDPAISIPAIRSQELLLANQPRKFVLSPT